VKFGFQCKGITVNTGIWASRVVPVRLILVEIFAILCEETALTVQIDVKRRQRTRGDPRRLTTFFDPRLVRC
jgi:hypothetical protein